MGTKTTREMILDLLNKRISATVSEISSALGLTKADIRYQIRTLSALGLIETQKSEHPTQAGRPPKSYRISTQSRDHNYNELSSKLLEFILLTDTMTGSGEDRLRAFVQNWVSPLPEPSLTLRLRAAVKWLNDHHYDAAWEARPDHPIIRIRACPYAVLAANQPALCGMDQMIIETLLKVPVRQTSKFDAKANPLRTCVFMI